jgi:hypothetical protein
MGQFSVFGFQFSEGKRLKPIIEGLGEAEN